MTHEEITAVLNAVQSDQSAVDGQVHRMCRLVSGRIRVAGSMDWATRRALARIKTELRDFDSRSGCWKN